MQIELFAELTRWWFDLQFDHVNFFLCEIRIETQIHQNRSIFDFREIRQKLTDRKKFSRAELYCEEFFS